MEHCNGDNRPCWAGTFNRCGTADCEAARQRRLDRTHAFQIVRPVNPQITAIYAKCQLVLPRGPILSIGPYGLPPCGEQPPSQDNG